MAVNSEIVLELLAGSWLFKSYSQRATGASIDRCLHRDSRGKERHDFDIFVVLENGSKGLIEQFGCPMIDEEHVLPQVSKTMARNRETDHL